MIYDVTQMGSIRAAQGTTAILSLCKEVNMPAETYEGGMIAIDLGYEEPVLIQRGEWLIVNTTSQTVDVIDDQLFQDEFWIMH